MMEVLDKLEILAQSARYDVSCASSGASRTAVRLPGACGWPGRNGSVREAPARAPGGRFGSAASMGICHSFADDGRCVSLLKVLLTNACVNDCAYCVNRRSSSLPRAGFRVEELVALTEAFYRRNYIEGLFLSSGVLGTPDLTMEMMIRTARSLRLSSGFAGYIHLKVIPGCSPLLVHEAGFWADRLSVNLELPSDRSLRLLAPEKTGSGIMGLMRSMRGAICRSRAELRAGSCDRVGGPPASRRWPARPTFASADWAPAGQSTQLVVGASPESDRHILTLSENLYGRYSLRRVYYSAFAPAGPDPRLPALSGPPLRREHRLYQADWLLRFYGFSAAEVLEETHPFLDLDLDPKTAWALRNRDRFPIEVTRAGYEELLRVPGLGQKSARRIVDARRHGRVGFDTLERIGVVMKRARWFLTCGGMSLDRLELPSEALRLRLRQAETGGWARGQLPLFDPRDLSTGAPMGVPSGVPLGVSMGVQA
jgi:putative DNA modification/repair radical SAM protein